MSRTWLVIALAAGVLALRQSGASSVEPLRATAAAAVTSRSAGVTAFTLPGGPEPQESRRQTLTFHTFDIEEVFSTPDGSVQFVELREADGMNGQNHFEGKHLTSNTQDFTYPTDLPGTATANRRFLMATPDFVRLPGAVTPDYIIPPGFISTAGDTLALRETAVSRPEDTLVFGPGDLPLDGVFSLNRDLTTGVNSPTNFLGQTGSIDAGPGVPALSRTALAALALGLIVVAGVVCRRRAEQPAAAGNASGG